MRPAPPLLRAWPSPPSALSATTPTTTTASSRTAALEATRVVTRGMDRDRVRRLLSATSSSAATPPPLPRSSLLPRLSTSATWTTTARPRTSRPSPTPSPPRSPSSSCTMRVDFLVGKFSVPHRGVAGQLCFSRVPG